MADERGGTDLLKVVSLAAAAVGLVVKAVKSVVGFVRRVDRIEAAQAHLVRDEDLAPQLAQIRMALREVQLHAEHDGARVAVELGAIVTSLSTLESRLANLERPKGRRR